MKRTLITLNVGTIDGSDYLFHEAGGFGVKNRSVWKSQWFVMKRKSLTITTL